MTIPALTVVAASARLNARVSEPFKIIWLEEAIREKIEKEGRRE
jgi:hypothetical protein|tara:strand:- start:344 stop:475 length:132 start_codon:yes stop_codon:yes gene_type:complete